MENDAIIPNNPSQIVSKSQSKKMLLIKVTCIICLILLIIFILKFTNILSIGSKKINKTSDKNFSQQVAPTERKRLFSCPVAEKECSKLNPALNDKKEYIGVFASKISENAPVIAVMDGDYSVEQELEKTLIKLKSSSGFYQAEYHFTGKAKDKSGSVKQGDVIGTTGIEEKFFFQIRNLKKDIYLPIMAYEKGNELIVNTPSTLEK